MTTRAVEKSPLIRARVAGFLYLLANIPAPFALLYLPSLLIVRGDAAATARNIMASESLFRLGIAATFFNQIVILFVVLALFQLLKVVNKSMAVLMVMFVLAAVPIGMLNELTHFAVLVILGGGDTLKAFTAPQLQALAMLFLSLHRDGINMAQIFWGLWLFPMGYLVFNLGFMPRIIGVTLMIGCFGYVIQSLADLLLPNLNVNIIFYTSWGELLFVLWLLIKGVNVEQWEKRALESA